MTHLNKNDEESDGEIIPSSCPNHSFGESVKEPEVSQVQKNLSNLEEFELTLTGRESSQLVAKFPRKSKRIKRKKLLSIVDELSKSQNSGIDVSDNCSQILTKDFTNENISLTNLNKKNEIINKENDTNLNESLITEITKNISSSRQSTPKKTSNYRKDFIRCFSDDASLCLESKHDALEDVSEFMKTSPVNNANKNKNYSDTSFGGKGIKDVHSEVANNECKTDDVDSSGRLSSEITITSQKFLSSGCNNLISNNVNYESEPMFSEDLFSETNLQRCAPLTERISPKKNIVSSQNSSGIKDQVISQTSPSKTNNITKELNRNKTLNCLHHSQSCSTGGALDEKIFNHYPHNEEIHSKEGTVKILEKEKTKRNKKSSINDSSPTKDEILGHVSSEEEFGEKERKRNKKSSIIISSPTKDEIHVHISSEEEFDEKERKRKKKCSINNSSPTKDEIHGHVSSEEEFENNEGKRNKKSSIDSISPRKDKQISNLVQEELMNEQTKCNKKSNINNSSPRKDEIHGNVCSEEEFGEKERKRNKKSSINNNSPRKDELHGHVCSEEEFGEKERKRNKKSSINNNSPRKDELHGHVCSEEEFGEKERKHNKKSSINNNSPRKDEIHGHVCSEEEFGEKERKRNKKSSINNNSPRKDGIHDYVCSEEEFGEKERKRNKKCSINNSSPTKDEILRHVSSEEEFGEKERKRNKKSSVNKSSPTEDELHGHVSSEEEFEKNRGKRNKNSSIDSTSPREDNQFKNLVQEEWMNERTKSNKTFCTKNSSPKKDEFHGHVSSEEDFWKNERKRNQKSITNKSSPKKDEIHGHVNSEEAFGEKERKRNKKSSVNKSSPTEGKYMQPDLETLIDASSVENFTEAEIREIRNKVNSVYGINEKLSQKLLQLEIKVTWKLSNNHDSVPFVFNGSYYTSPKPEMKLKHPKMGSFEIHENEAIVSRWRQFCELYRFNVKKDFKGFLPKEPGAKYHPLSREQKLKFVQFLAQDLPDRLLPCVYSRFVEMFKYYNKGRFSNTEDEILLFLHRRFEKRKKYGLFSLLAALLHRSRYSIYRRMKILLENGHNKQIREGTEEESAPSSSCRSSPKKRRVNRRPKEESELSTDYNSSSPQRKDEISSSTDDRIELEELTTSTSYINKNVDYLQTTISRLSGSEDVKKWDKYITKTKRWRNIGKKCNLSPQEAKIQYFCAARIRVLPQKKSHNCFSLEQRIIDRFKKHKWKKWKHINWNILSEELSDLGSIFLYHIFRRCVKKQVPKEYWPKLKHCINYLDRKTLPTESY